jgi:hypothetical protein
VVDGIVVHERKSAPGATPDVSLVPSSPTRQLRWASIDVRRELEPLNLW